MHYTLLKCLMMKLIVETSFEHLFSIGEFKMHLSLTEETTLTPKICMECQPIILNAASKIIYEYCSVHCSFPTKLCSFSFCNVSNWNAYLILSQSTPSSRWYIVPANTLPMLSSPAVRISQTAYYCSSLSYL